MITVRRSSLSGTCLAWGAATLLLAGCQRLGWDQLRAPSVAATPPPDAPADPVIPETVPAPGDAAGRLYQIGGASYTVAVRDDLAYLGIGPRVVALDVHPSAPVRPVAQSAVLGGVVRALVLDGEDLWVAAEGGGVYVLSPDTTGGEPLALRQQVATPGPAQDLAVVGRYTYVACEPTFVAVLERDEAGQVREVGRFDAGGHPQPGGWTPTGPVSVGLDAVEQHVYLASEGLGLVVVDVSDATAPRQVAWMPLPESHDVVVSEGVAFIAPAGAFDVHDPANPGYLETGESLASNGAVIADGRLVSPQGILDVHDPAHPRSLARWDDYRFSRPAVAGARIFIPGGEFQGGLEVRELGADGDAPIVASFMVPTVPFPILAADGERLRLTDSLDSPSLEADIAVPGKIALTWQPPGVATMGWTQNSEIAFRKDKYVIRAGSQWLAVNRADKPDIQVAWIPLHAAARDVALSGDLLYVADSGMDGDEGREGPRFLEVVNVKDPERPYVVGWTTFDVGLLAIAAGNGMAYVLDGGWDVNPMYSPPSHLAIVDVHDAAHPRRVGGLRLDDAGQDLTVDGTSLHVATRYGWRKVDVSDPTRPRIVDRRALPGLPVGVARVGDALWFATLYGGLVGLPLAGEAPREQALPLSLAPRATATPAAEPPRP